MKFENPMTFIRAIKGAPSSILWALIFTKSAMTGKELASWTGYGDDNITNGLHLLTELGWVVAHSSRGPWSLAEGRQLPLMPFSMFDESEKIGLATSTTTLIEEENNYIGRSRSKELKAPRSPIKSDSRKNPNFEANLKACRHCGIGDPKATSISDMLFHTGEPVTPDFIQAHVDSLHKDEVIGLAIVRIQSEETPRLWNEEIDATSKHIRSKGKRK